MLALLKARDMISDRDATEEMNALMLSTKQGHSECLKILLEYGLSVNEQNQDGATALIIVAQNHDVKCLQLLIDYNAKINVQDDYGVTALMYAATGSAECTKVLIDIGANLEIMDIWKNNALLRSLMEDVNSDAMCALLLIGAGCELNEVNYNGDTALFCKVYLYRLQA